MLSPLGWRFPSFFVLWNGVYRCLASVERTPRPFPLVRGRAVSSGVVGERTRRPFHMRSMCATPNTWWHQTSRVVALDASFGGTARQNPGTNATAHAVTAKDRPTSLPCRTSIRRNWSAFGATARKKHPQGGSIYLLSPANRVFRHIITGFTRDFKPQRTQRSQRLQNYVTFVVFVAN